MHDYLIMVGMCYQCRAVRSPRLNKVDGFINLGHLWMRVSYVKHHTKGLMDANESR
jgi:hypothetical protein